MENIEGLSKEELKELIVEHLKEMGIDPDPIDIEVSGPSSVVLRGKVDFETEREMIKRTISDVLDIEEIEDELVAIEGMEEDPTEDGDIESAPEDDVYDEESEFMGTEDAFQSVEDGIPYIPPTSPTYQESPDNVKWKKKRKKRY